MVDVVFRLAVYAVLAVAPTLLFLALWRGLMYLRDDELVERVFEEREAEMAEVSGGADGGLGAHLLCGRLAPVPASDGESGVAACRACGAANMAGATFCRECLGRLGGS